MPPHLHPRSTATSTLFAGTLLASFVVVAIPHVLPCPQRRRIGYQDTETMFDADGKPAKRNQKIIQDQLKITDDMQYSAGKVPGSAKKPKTLSEDAELFRLLQKEAEVVETKDRECPVPKPTTLLGRLMGKKMSGE